MSVQQLVDAARKGKMAKVKALVRLGVDVNGQASHGKSGRTALHQACAHGWLDIATFLIHQQHANLQLNLRDHSGVTALSWAAMHNHAPIVQLLLAQPKVQVNIPNSIGWTALHAASYCGHAKVVQLLLRHPKIDLSVRNKDGKTAMDCAMDRGRMDIHQLFHAHHKTQQLNLEKVSISQNQHSGASLQKQKSQGERGAPPVISVYHGGKKHASLSFKQPNLCTSASAPTRPCKIEDEEEVGHASSFGSAPPLLRNAQATSVSKLSSSMCSTEYSPYRRQKTVASIFRRMVSPPHPPSPAATTNNNCDLAFGRSLNESFVAKEELVTLQLENRALEARVRRLERKMALLVQHIDIPK